MSWTPRHDMLIKEAARRYQQLLPDLPRDRDIGHCGVVADLLVEIAPSYGFKATRTDMVVPVARSSDTTVHAVVTLDDGTVLHSPAPGKNHGAGARSLASSRAAERAPAGLAETGGGALGTFSDA